MTPEEEMTQFLIDHGAREKYAALTVEAWYNLISFNVKRAETGNALHGFTKEQTFSLFTEGMVKQLSEEINCDSEELLIEIQKTLAACLETEDNEGEGLPATEVEHLFSVFPMRSFLSNNEFNRQLTKGLINSGPQEIIFDKKHHVTPELEVTRPANASGLKMYGNYTYFDSEVSRGIDDIYMAHGGSCFFTLQTLYRAINHDPDARADEKEKAAMIDSIESQRVTKASGSLKSVKKEAERRKIDVSGIPDTIDDMLIDVRGGTMEAGGEVVPVYFIKERPWPSLFGSLLGQEVKIPAKAYNVREIDSRGTVTTKTLSTNPARIAIRGYIIDRIYAMKKDLSLAHVRFNDNEYKRKKNKSVKSHSVSYYRSLKSDTILYSSIFDAAGLSDIPRNTKTRHKEYIKQCLEYLRAINEIKGFKLICGSRKNSVDRVRIILE